MRAAATAPPHVAHFARPLSGYFVRGRVAGSGRPPRREAFVDSKPSRVIDDAPFGQIDHEHLGRIGFHAQRAAALPHLLDPAVDVHAAIALVEKDRADGARRPRSAAAPPCGWCRHALMVELVRDRLLSATREVVANKMRSITSASRSLTVATV